MAREIKYFSGNSSGTLYTVPVGRTAKVIFNYMAIPSGTYTVTVGGIPAYSSTASSFTLGTPVLAESTATSTVVPGDNQALAALGSEPVIVTNVWFLGAGASVSAGIAVGHSFLVIEEY